ncbi:hypothetical protein [Neobacillus cucumis]|uniref:hypothetical protein n=1 Tax=Neobacillus cucumis TaxID=1740721 RepID=UPI00196426FB|nr:hypothetical protein [Neobacillus cucumis]MBM7653474.1 capsule polysaccharide export protein KpsE/RkpR [Neobacillus cucumis]
MNNELKDSLRSVLREELQPINKRLDTINKRLDTIEPRFVTIETRMNVIDQELKEIKIGQEKFQTNMIESLGQYTDKIAEHVDVKTEVLNKCVYALETEVERLTRQ